MFAKDGAGRANWGSNDEEIAEGQAEVDEVVAPPTEGAVEEVVAPVVVEAAAEEVDDSVSLDAYFSQQKITGT
jgi:hypothetical protein